MTPSLLFVLVCIAGVLAFVVYKIDRRTHEDAGYRLRRSLMNSSEAAFMHELTRTLPAGYQAFPKVRMIDFLEPTKGKGTVGRRNRIWAKHVDLLVCDATFRPVLAIEVNGGSHRAPHRKARDQFVARVYEEVGLLFEEVRVGADFGAECERIVRGLTGSTSTNNEAV